MTSKSKSWIVVLENGKVVKRYSVTVLNSGESIRIVMRKKKDGSSLVKQFKTATGKPAMRMGLEAAILAFKDYNPAIHSVTVLAREAKPEKKEVFKVLKKKKRKKARLESRTGK